MLIPRRTVTFKKEYALAIKRGWVTGKLDEVITMLINEQALPPERLDHPLRGAYRGFRECHIQGDWVLIYRIFPKERRITFARTGTHADLF